MTTGKGWGTIPVLAFIGVPDLLVDCLLLPGVSGHCVVPHKPLKLALAPGVGVPGIASASSCSVLGGGGFGVGHCYVSQCVHIHLRPLWSGLHLQSRVA